MTYPPVVIDAVHRYMTKQPLDLFPHVFNCGRFDFQRALFYAGSQSNNMNNIGSLGKPG